MMTKMIASPPRHLFWNDRRGHRRKYVYYKQSAMGIGTAYSFVDPVVGANAHRALARACQGAKNCIPTCMIRAYCLSGRAAAKVLAMTLYPRFVG